MRNLAMICNAKNVTALKFLSKRFSNLLSGAVIGLAFVVSQNAIAACPAVTLPRKVELKERIISLTTSFKVTAGEQNLGEVKAKFFSLTDTFTYEDAGHQKVAEARTRIFSWGTHIDVTDCEGRKIGEIKENIFKSWFKVYTMYSILDANGNLLAQSEKIDWVGTEFNLRDARGNGIAKISRPWINLITDKWTIEIWNPPAIDHRLFIMIGAFKTHIDNKRRAEDDDNNNE
jgi:uncharacterized protein YxjI